MTAEEFKKLTYKFYDEFYQSMSNMYRAFNKMHELYNTFEFQPDILWDHNTRRRVASKAFDNVLYWKKHIKDRPHDFPLMDKLQNKKTQVMIET